MGLISVGTHHYKIKKQNSKRYYTTFTEPYKYFRKGFYKVYYCIVYITYSKKILIYKMKL